MRRAALALVAVGVLAGVVIPATVAPAQTPALQSYAATAAADAVRTSVIVPDYLIVSDVVDLGAPSAQATISSLGSGQGFAAAPYPGATTLSLGPTLTSLGGLPPLPAYPLVASSNASSPEQRVDGSGYSLSSRSTETSVTSSAEVGVSGSAGSTSATATTSIGDDGGSVTADSSTVTSGFSLTNLVTVGQVASRARATARPDQPVELSQSFVVDGLSLVGVPVRLTTNGLEVASTLTPLSIGDLLKQLTASGVTVTVLTPMQTEHGIVAGGMSISYPLTIPAGPKVIVTVQLGRAFADATATGADADSDSPPSTADSPTAAPVVSAPAVGRGTTVSASPSTTPTTPATRSSVEGAEPVGQLSFPSYWSMYLVVVAGALALVALTQVVRLLGVKLWIS